jgi:hypothetical protein
MTNGKRIFLSGGCGDVLSLEGHWDDQFKQDLTTIYHACKRTQWTDLFRHLPEHVYPNLTTIESVWPATSKRNHYLYMNDVYKDDPRLSDKLKGVEDWGIIFRFPKINDREYEFVGSSFLKHTLATLEDFDLPTGYVVCQADTISDGRSLGPKDWDGVLRRAAGRPVVVLGLGQGWIPEDPSIIDLRDGTSLAQAIEILKAATGFYGVDSCLSVLAFQLPFADLAIKVKNTWHSSNARCYCAPRKAWRDFCHEGL